ncbi:MAG: HAMP domain-containing histidine kinase [Caldilineaceae bacterium]|nr:HAMP domain-containing histidine kinase [Caldilineaceae bacterium]
MWNSLKSLLAGPTFSEPEIAETAYWLNIFLVSLTFVICLLGFVFPLLFTRDNLDLSLIIADLVTLALNIGILALMRLGHVRLAATLSILVLFSIVTYAITGIFDGIRSPNLLAYFVLIPLTGLLLGKQTMLRFVILCMLVVAAIFYLEAAHILIPVARQRSNAEHLITWCIAIVFNTILLMAMLHRTESNARVAQEAMTALVKANEELQKSQTQLQQAIAKEKELSELKSRFVSMASHEFRTPLATMLLLTETLSLYRHKLTDEQIGQRLDKMQEQVGHLKEIMDDVLQLARLQARRMEFKPELLDLDEFCQSVIEEFQSLPESTHRLGYQGDESLSSVYLDKRLMRQIISNLISNAIKYSATDKSVGVILAHTDETIMLQVRDEGIGIPPADLPHLFEPFHRATNVGSIAGTGLGLVIAKEAVELHGGMISVASQVGVGTTFTVNLPITTRGTRTNGESVSR